MKKMQNGVVAAFSEASIEAPTVILQSLPESLQYFAHIVNSILEGEKPPLFLPDSKRSSQEAAFVSLLQKMEKYSHLHENWEQFVLLPLQDPNGKMANGVTSINVMCSPLNENRKFWEQKFKAEGIVNNIILGAIPAMRIQRGQFDVHECAQSFMLPEGDLDSLDQFLKVLAFNATHPSSARTLVVDNRNGFWNALKAQVHQDLWAILEVCFAESEEEVVSFIKENVDAQNLQVAPLQISGPFTFEHKNPVSVLGSGNPKKIADTRVIYHRNAPLLKMVDFLSTIGPFAEPPEKSITCVGNALEKMNAMFDVVYSSDGNIIPEMTTRYDGRPIVMIANDTSARIRFVNNDGIEVPVNFVDRPELSKSKHFVAEGKGRWWPGPEIKMIASAEGKSTVFYTEKLPELVRKISEEVGEQVHIEYTDESVYLFAVLAPKREDVKFFATKGTHVDDMVFEYDPSIGEADYETFTVPLDDNPERRTRAQSGDVALLRNSATLQGLNIFLETTNFPEGVNCLYAFDQAKGKKFTPRVKSLVVLTLSSFDPDAKSYGFKGFKQTISDAGFRTTPRKFDFDNLEGFEKYLSTADAILLGGNEGVNLSPLKRAALISRIFVAIQTAHPSFAGKPLVFVKEQSDPLCEWFLNTQDFLYNHKLYGRRAQDSFMVSSNLHEALKASKAALQGYEAPVISIPESYYNGDDSFDRPSVSILGSASTYDPQHISMGQRFAEGCGERNLHFRHGGCARGVVGGAADAFAAYRDAHSKGRMTGVQCHGLVKLEGMNEGNDCVKIHKTIGERKLDVYKSDLLVFGSGGWGTFEELFDMLALVEAGKIKPEAIIIMDYAFDATPDETTYQPVREFFDAFLTPDIIRNMNIHFVKNEVEALSVADHYLPRLWSKYQKPTMRPEKAFRIA